MLIARQAARRVGVADHGPLLRRSRAAVGVALCRRAAAMVQACLPKLSPDGVQLLYGYAEEGSKDICTRSVGLAVRGPLERRPRGAQGKPYIFKIRALEF